MAIPVGSKAEGSAFFDRETERKDIWQILEANHLLLSGPRRLGKTSLLQKLAEEAAEKDIWAQLVDVEGIDSIDAFLTVLEQAFPDQTVSNYLQSAGEKVTGWLGRLRKFDIKLPGGLGGGIELQSVTDANWADSARYLQKRLSNAPLLIFIDEFSVFLEKLLAKDESGAVKLLGWLRVWRMSSGVNCRFIFSGSIGINTLLDRHRLTTYFNDCYDFKLGQFGLNAALKMLNDEALSEGWQGELGIFEHLCNRTSWLSPFYLNLLLLESIRSGSDRELEAGQSDRHLQLSDIDDGYNRLLATRSRFIHWFRRLERDLDASDFAFVRAILAAVAKPENGLTRKQLLTRLQRLVADPDQRSLRLDNLLLKLEEDGYITQEAERIQFLSFLLRDYWRRNHG